MRSSVQEYFIRFIEQVSERKFILSWLTEIVAYPQLNDTYDELKRTMIAKTRRFELIEKGEIYERTVKDDRHFFVVTDNHTSLYPPNDDGTVNNHLTLEHIGSNLPQPLIKLHNNITLNPGEMVNFKGPEPIVTTPAIMLINQRIFVESFGDVVPYVNVINPKDEITVKMLDDLLVKLLTADTITAEQGHLFQTNAYDLGHFCELSNKTFSAKSFTTHPEIPRIKKERLAAMTEEDKKDPIKLAQLEAELGALDKEWMKGDDADLFHEAQGEKSYGVHRKKMFIMVGAIPSFTDKGEATFSFIPQALTEGWSKEHFATIVNEIYKGSYDRGKETAKGGELTKYVLRVYQDLGITELDCGTERGSIVELLDDPKNKANTMLIGRTLVSTGVPLTAEDIIANAGKKIEIRDPMFCKTKNGLCYKCMGYPFEAIQETDIGAYILDISSGIMMISMKNMHGTKLTTFEFNYEDYFVTT